MAKQRSTLSRETANLKKRLSRRQEALRKQVRLMPGDDEYKRYKEAFSKELKSITKELGKINKLQSQRSTMSSEKYNKKMERLIGSDTAQKLSRTSIKRTSSATKKEEQARIDRIIALKNEMSAREEAKALYVWTYEQEWWRTLDPFNDKEELEWYLMEKFNDELGLNLTTPSEMYEWFEDLYHEELEYYIKEQELGRSPDLQDFTLQTMKDYALGVLE